MTRLGLVLLVVGGLVAGEFLIAYVMVSWLGSD